MLLGNYFATSNLIIMLRTIGISLVCYLLIFVLSYTTASKLINFSHYSRSMLSQPFAQWISYLLIYLLPIVEVWIIVLLLRQRWQKWGLLFSAILMSAFTFYVVYIYASGLDKSVCPCGGLFSRINWKQHLIVNSLLTAISFLAYFTYSGTDNLFHGRAFPCQSQ